MDEEKEAGKMQEEIIFQSQPDPEEKKEMDPLDVLKIFSPGTAIRTALDDILRARMGALIVVEKEGLSEIVEGGFRVNCRFSAQKLVELAKMDGAIILSEDLKKIHLSHQVTRFPRKKQEPGTRRQKEPQNNSEQ
mgnify:CR=1 FL=1